MATEITNRQVNVFIETGDAKRALDVLLKKEQELKDALSRATDPKTVERLTQELKKLGTPIDTATKKLKGELSPTLRELTQTVGRLDRELRNLSREDPNFARKVLQFKQAKASLDEARAAAAGFDKSLSSAGSSGIFGKLQSGAAGFAKNFVSGFGIGAGLTIAQEAASAVSSFFTSTIEEAKAAEAATANFKQTLESVGKSNDFERLAADAQRLAEQFGFLDNDDIINGFERFIRVGGITEQQMQELASVAADLTAKQQLAGNTAFTYADAVEIVSKGVTGSAKELKKFGVDIGDAGTKSERAAAIIDQLGKAVNGAGEAFGENTRGKIAKNTQEIKNLQEEIGTQLNPALEQLKAAGLSVFKAMLDGFGSIGNAVENLYLKIFNRAGLLRKQIQQATEDGAAVANELVTEIKKLSDADLGAVITRTTQTIEKQRTALKNSSKDEILAAEKSLSFSREKLKLLQQEVEARATANKKIKEDPNDTTGSGTANTPENLFEKFIEQQRKLRAKVTDEQFNANDTALQKELTQNIQSYQAIQKALEEALKKQQLTKTQYDQLSKENFILQKEQEAVIVDRFFKAELARIDKEEKAKLKARNEAVNKAGLEAQAQLSEELAQLAADQIGDKQAGLELAAIKAKGRKKLQAELELLNFQEQQELATTKATGVKREKIEAEFDAKRKAAVIAYYTELVNNIAEITNQLLPGIQSIFEQLTAKENAELEQNRRNNDRRKKNYDSLLSKQLISRADYDKKIEALDRQVEAKEKQAAIKQFNREKAINLVQATINGAQAVLKALAGPGGPILAAVVGGLVAVQIGLIASSKPPQFARGGKLSGPSHANGGVPLYGNGQFFGEAEGGESIINKRAMRSNKVYSVTGTVSQITSTLNRRYGGTSWDGEASLVPLFANGGRLPQVNYSRGAQAIQQRQQLFANGGITSGTSAPGTEIQNTLAQLNSTVNALTTRLNSGIYAVTSIHRLNTDSSRLEALKRNVTMS